MSPTFLDNSSLNVLLDVKYHQSGILVECVYIYSDDKYMIETDRVIAFHVYSAKSCSYQMINVQKC